MQTVARNVHFVVERWISTPLVRVTRTHHAGDAEETWHCLREVTQALDTLDRSQHVLLLDLREGPFRTEPALEEAAAPFQARLFRGFAKVAVLARTSVGRLQVQRLARDTGAHIVFFEEDAAAITYLLPGTTKLPPRAPLGPISVTETPIPPSARNPPASTRTPFAPPPSRRGGF
jgi:hypothetical protein